MSHHASGPNFEFPRGDARLDMTDLFVFPKPGDSSRSIIVLDVHPSFRLDSPKSTTTEPFAPGALYEIKIDTNGDAIADICYSVQFASSEDGKQAATVRRAQGARAVSFCHVVLSYDPRRPVSFPHNGRTLTDDVADVFFSMYANRNATDKVGPHRDLLDEFPYLGPPHSIESNSHNVTSGGKHGKQG